MDGRERPPTVAAHRLHLVRGAGGGPDGSAYALQHLSVAEEIGQRAWSRWPSLDPPRSQSAPGEAAAYLNLAYLNLVGRLDASDLRRPSRATT